MGFLEGTDGTGSKGRAAERKCHHLVLHLAAAF